MDVATARNLRRGAWALVRLPVAVLLVGWGLLALVGASVHCGDACSGDAADPESWQWSGQLYLVVFAAVAAAHAVAFGLVDRQRWALASAAVTVASAVVWFSWVTALGF